MGGEGQSETKWGGIGGEDDDRSKNLKRAISDMKNEQFLEDCYLNRVLHLHTSYIVPIVSF